MLVCIDKVTCARMHELIELHWKTKAKDLEKRAKAATDQQGAIALQRQAKWVNDTLAAVVISEEQGEVARFRKWGIDITPHRRLLKEGFTLADASSIDAESALSEKATRSA